MATTPNLSKAISEMISSDGNIIPGSPTIVNPPATPPVEKVVETPPEEVVEPVEEGESIDYAKFIEAAGKTPEEPKVVEPPKPEVKPEVKPVGKPGKVARDYSDLPEEDKALFEKMGNEAFAKFKPIYLEHKKLQADITAKATEIENTRKALDEAKKGIVKVPDSYAEHPQAFVLTPEFANATKQLQNAQLIHNHWVQQLENVRGGAKEIDYLEVNPQTGQYYISQKIPADIKSETQLLTFVNHAQNLLYRANGDIQTLQQNYTKYHNDSVAMLRQQEKQFFEAFDKEENKKTYEPLIQEALNSIPPVFRSSPIAMSFAKSLVLNTVLGRMLQKAAKPANGTTVKKTLNRQPSAAEAASEGNGKPNDNGEDVTIDEFERVKAGINTY